MCCWSFQAGNDGAEMSGKSGVSGMKDSEGVLPEAGGIQPGQF